MKTCSYLGKVLIEPTVNQKDWRDAERAIMKAERAPKPDLCGSVHSMTIADIHSARIARRMKGLA